MSKTLTWGIGRELLKDGEPQGCNSPSPLATRFGGNAMELLFCNVLHTFNQKRLYEHPDYLPVA